MKKLFGSVGVLVAFTCLIGCNSKIAPPEISFGDAPVAAVKAGETKEIAVTVKTKGSLKRVSFFRKNENGEEELFATPVVKFPVKDKYESVVTLQDINVGLVFVVEAVDTKGQTNRAEYVITIADSTAKSDAPTGEKESSQSNAVSSTSSAGSSSPYTGCGIEIGFNKNTTIGSSFRLSKNKANLLGSAMQYSSSVDFMFFYGATNGVTIVAPGNELAEAVFNNPIYGVSLWETRNNTILVKSESSYDNAALESIQAEVDGQSSTYVEKLERGDVIAFKTESGQIGVVRLAYVGEDNTSTLNIEVKVLN